MTYVFFSRGFSPPPLHAYKRHETGVLRVSIIYRKLPRSFYTISFTFGQSFIISIHTRMFWIKYYTRLTYYIYKYTYTQVVGGSYFSSSFYFLFFNSRKNSVRRNTTTDQPTAFSFAHVCTHAGRTRSSNKSPLFFPPLPFPSFWPDKKKLSTYFPRFREKKNVFRLLNKKIIIINDF